MIKYFGAAAALAAAYGIEGATEVTAAALIILSSIFYFIALKLFSGLSQSAITNSQDVDVLKLAMIYMIYVTMFATVYVSEYSNVAFYAMPWLIIQSAINTLVLLIKFDIIGIDTK